MNTKTCPICGGTGELINIHLIPPRRDCDNCKGVGRVSITLPTQDQTTWSTIPFL